jgi:hypothetical protein
MKDDGISKEKPVKSGEAGGSDRKVGSDRVEVEVTWGVSPK